MKSAVRYYSKTGSTTRLADAIAEKMSCKADTVDVPLSETVDVLFLGGGVYGGSKIDSHLTDFIQKLTHSQVKYIVAFSCSNWKMSIKKQIIKALTDKNIVVLDEDIALRGQCYSFNKGRPNKEECTEAANFAKGLVSKIKI